jgi:PEP-CTERM motif
MKLSVNIKNASRLTTLGIILTLAPAAAWATTTSFAGPYSATNSIAFANWGGNTGLTLTALCGAGSPITSGVLGGNTCKLDDAGSPGTPLGVSSNAGGDSAWIDGHGTAGNDDFIMFQFNKNVTLTNIGLDISATSSWALYSCTGTAVSSCTTLLTSGAGTAANTAFNSTTFSHTGQDFAILATGNSTTAFGVNNLSYTYTATPEPATLGLVGLSLLGLGGLRLRRKAGNKDA